MAGMLPGVECARRRRFHQGGWVVESQSLLSGHGRTRRSSFCLYASSHESHLSTTSSLQRNMSNSSFNRGDQKLEDVAREAKERLDERLRVQKNSLQLMNRRTNTKVDKYSNKSDEDQSTANAQGSVVGNNNSGLDLRKDSTVSKSSTSKRLISWTKLMGWKASNQEECAVCLEGFEAAVGTNTQQVMNLPCAHRFHTRCLVPWLETNSHCPCCRLAWRLQDH